MTFVFSLVGGLLVAIALQLILANMGVALGLTVLDWAPTNSEASEPKDAENPLENSSPQPSSDASLPITHLLGFGVAAGFSTATFAASLIAVEFSLIAEPRRGGIFGLIVWATYWLLFVWISSTTLSGIANSLVGSAIAGAQQLISTVQSAIQSTTGRTTKQPSEKATLREDRTLRELAAKVSDLAEAQASLPDLLEQQKQTLLAELSDSASNSNDELEHSADVLIETDSVVTRPSTASTGGLLSQFDLPSWQQIARRALNQVDLSDWDVEALLQKVPASSLVQDYLPGKTSAAQLSGSATTTVSRTAPDTDGLEPSEQPSKDLSHKNKSSEHAPQPTGQHSTIKAIQEKLIAYCRYTNTDLLTPENLAQKVASQIEEQGLLVDSEIVLNSLPLDFDAIAATLSKRKKLSSAKTKALITTLHTSWPSPPSPSSQSGPIEEDDNASFSIQSAAQAGRERLAHHLKSIDWAAVSLEDVKPSISFVLEELEKTDGVRSLDWKALVTQIEIPSQSKQALTEWLGSVWSESVQATHQSAQAVTTQLSDKISHYLNHEDKSALHPKKLNQHLTQIVGSTLATLNQLEDKIESKLEDNVSLPTVSSPTVSFPTVSSVKDAIETVQTEVLWDKSTWQAALAERKDLTAEEIQRVLTWGETVWQPKSQQISHWMRLIQSEIEQGLPQPDGHLAKAAYGQIEQRVDLAQEKLATQAKAVKEEIQQQTNEARKQVAIAAWWLLIALVSSGSAAMGAGWLAAIY